MNFWKSIEQFWSSAKVVCILIRTASFPRFWRNHPQCRKNDMYLIWTSCLFSLRWSKTMVDSKKTSFSSSAISQYFFKKFLWFGPWVSRIDWCEWHWCGSTYMVMRLSDITLKTGKICVFCVFRLSLSLCQISSQPYRLSQTNVLRINQFY